MLRLPRRNSCTSLYTAGLCAFLAIGASQPAGSQTTRIEGIRFWSFGDVTRVAIETRGEYTIHTEELASPARLFFDLHGLKPPEAQHKGIHSIQVGDRLVKQIRVAETLPGVTRVVFDLEAEVEFSWSQLANPDRLVIEIRTKGHKSNDISVTRSQTGTKRFDSAAEEPAGTSATDFAPLPGIGNTATPVLSKPATVESRPLYRSAEPFWAAQTVRVQPTRKAVPDLAALYPPPAIPYLVPMLTPTLRAFLYGPSERLSAMPVARYRGPKAKQPSKEKIAPADDLPTLDSSEPPKKPAVVTVAAAPAKPARTPASGAAVSSGSPSAPAKIDSSGNRSLVRVFGLKMGKIVIDAGHGGHDTGTIGPHGLLEKDLVLDVALRLGQLIQSKMGSEVVYTRSDDSFIPLEQRPQIANEEKADLFISIHANSAPIANATGVETYYFNFTTEKSALDLATRENATATSSIHELNDLLQKAVLKAKVEESREFAQKVQVSLYGMSAKMNASARDRGVRKAPFVVLIGATMPSILAEVGFVSNPHDEPLLKKAEQREKIAEALFKGIEQYSNTLSHVQMARVKAARE